MIFWLTKINTITKKVALESKEKNKTRYLKYVYLSLITKNDIFLFQLQEILCFIMI